MTTDELDPLIHVPTRLRIVAALAAQPDGDPLSFARLQDMIGLTPGNLIIHLRKLEEGGYVASEKTKDGTAPKTTVTLTGRGRAALGAYTQALRDLLGGLDEDRRGAEAGRIVLFSEPGARDAPGVQAVMASRQPMQARARRPAPTPSPPRAQPPSRPDDRIRHAPHNQTQRQASPTS